VVEKCNLYVCLGNIFFVLAESVTLELIRQVYLYEFEFRNIEIKTTIEILVKKLRKIASG
jgi:hypothetical protein